MNRNSVPSRRSTCLELLRDGTVPVNTHIRRPGDREWTTIEQVFGPNVLKKQELSPRAALTPSAESKFFTDSPTLVNLHTSSGDSWYWNVVGETFGPGSLEDVIHSSK